MKNFHSIARWLTLSLCFACGGPEHEGSELYDDTSAEAESASPDDESPDESGTTTLVDKITCPKACTVVAATPPTSCCNCNGQDRRWVRSAFSPNVWLCNGPL